MTSRATARPAPATVYATLRELLDPEVGLNVIDLGMIGEVTVCADGAVLVEILPTTPGCPMHEALATGVQRLVGGLAGVTAVEVRFVYDPPWTPERIAPEARALLGLR
jgi:metal-sulfur cluster biosynthetic enzyme